MKFSDAVRHLENMGLAVVMPNGKLYPTSKRLRNPRGFIPVRVVKKGDLPKDLRDMMRQTRAEYRKFRSRRNGR